MSKVLDWPHDMFNYDPPATSMDQEIQCPDCGEWSVLREWAETEMWCEDCGSHTAIRCPKCEMPFDHVFGPAFKVRDV